MSSILVYFFTVLSTILTRTIYTNAALIFQDFHQRIPSSENDRHPHRQTILILNLDFRLQSKTIFGKHSILSIVKTISQIYRHGCSFRNVSGFFYLSYLSILLFLIIFGKFLHYNYSKCRLLVIFIAMDILLFHNFKILGIVLTHFHRLVPLIHAELEDKVSKLARIPRCNDQNTVFTLYNIKAPFLDLVNLLILRNNHSLI